MKREAFLGPMTVSAVPPGLKKGGCSFPTVKTVGYYQSSLQDFRNRN